MPLGNRAFLNFSLNFGHFLKFVFISVNFVLQNLSYDIKLNKLLRVFNIRKKLKFLLAVNLYPAVYDHANPFRSTSDPQRSGPKKDAKINGCRQRTFDRLLGRWRSFNGWGEDMNANNFPGPVRRFNVVSSGRMSNKILLKLVT
jgi:hypothetical protein